MYCSSNAWLSSSWVLPGLCCSDRRINRRTPLQNRLKNTSRIVSHSSRKFWMKWRKIGLNWYRNRKGFKLKFLLNKGSSYTVIWIKPRKLLEFSVVGFGCSLETKDWLFIKQNFKCVRDNRKWYWKLWIIYCRLILTMLKHINCIHRCFV